jgi:hypothetical protein
MTNEEIEKRAIGKAYRGGLKKADWGNVPFRYFIFDHRFAKAFWGMDHDWVGLNSWNLKCSKCDAIRVLGEVPDGDCWQVGLLAMVLEEDPIRYLEQFLDKEDSGTRS